MTSQVPDGKRCYPTAKCGKDLAADDGEVSGVTLACEGKQTNFAKATTLESAKVVAKEKKEADAAAAAKTKSHAQVLVASMAVVLSAAACI